MTHFSWLPSPLALMPQPATAVTLGVVLNLFFKRHPDLKERMAELSDKIIQFEVEDLHQSYYMTVEMGGDLRIHSYSDMEPHVTMSGTSKAFIALLFGTRDPDSLFFSRELQLEGETDVGLLFKNILDNVEIDWEEELKAMLGSLPGGLATKMIARVKEEIDKKTSWSDEVAEKWFKESDAPRGQALAKIKAEIENYAERSEKLLQAISRQEKKGAVSRKPSSRKSKGSADKGTQS